MQSGQSAPQNFHSRSKSANVLIHCQAHHATKPNILVPMTYLNVNVVRLLCWVNSGQHLTFMNKVDSGSFNKHIVRNFLLFEEEVNTCNVNRTMLFDLTGPIPGETEFLPTSPTILRIASTKGLQTATKRTCVLRSLIVPVWILNSATIESCSFSMNKIVRIVALAPAPPTWHKKQMSLQINPLTK